MTEKVSHFAPGYPNIAIIKMVPGKKNVNYWKIYTYSYQGLLTQRPRLNHAKFRLYQVHGFQIIAD